ncbi:protein neprosin-like [Vicia villosa]|uniref:protein neprosin-like n=1 Tax=Vicia villosa TaxID=3911 RepID=UPI00273C9D81|nr:protein neprosin-like [Vicia villosa]
MIGILVFLFCLVNSPLVHGTRDILQEVSTGSETITNYAGAILRPSMSGTAFYGVRGTVSVYNPKVDQEQMSVASMFIANQDSNNFDAISVGWHVLPSLYQDSKTHLYIAWTSNNFEKGCTNLQCPGFIQTDKSIIIGKSFNQTSTIDKFPVELSLAILQDSSTKNWWIYINEKKIGYYPSSLFSNMTLANQIVWIGKTTNPTNTPSPPMGYGVKPNGVFGHACHFKKLAFVNNSRMQQSVTKDMGEVRSSNNQCYDARYYEDGTNGLTLEFGGPGGNNCENSS